MKRIGTILIAVAMLISLVACGPTTSNTTPPNATSTDTTSNTTPSNATSTDTTDTTPADSDVTKVGISYCEISVPFNVAQAEFLKEYGTEAGFDVTIINADNNVEKQVGDVEDLLNMGIQLLIIYPVNSRACDTLFELANKAGVDVVIMNTDVPGYTPGEDYLFLANGNNYDQGYIAGEWAADNFKGEKMKILHLTGSMSQQWSLDRGSGFEDALTKNFPEHEFVSTQCAECSRVTAQQMTVNVLQSTNGEVNVIYTHNDEMTLGAMAGVKEFGLNPGEDVMIIGIDLSYEMCEAIIDGDLSACVVIDPSTLPAAIYKEYVKYINGEEIGSYVGMELRMVDATNAQEEYDSGRILF